MPQQTIWEYRSKFGRIFLTQTWNTPKKAQLQNISRYIGVWRNREYFPYILSSNFWNYCHFDIYIFYSIIFQNCVDSREAPQKRTWKSYSSICSSYISQKVKYNKKFLLMMKRYCIFCIWRIEIIPVFFVETRDIHFLKYFEDVLFWGLFESGSKNWAKLWSPLLYIVWGKL